MTKHTMVTFQLHRKGVILIVILCLIVAVLLVAAGFMWGRSSAPKPAAVAAPKTAAATKPAAAPPPAQRFTLRIGIEPTEEDAKTLLKSLGAKKLAATIAPVETSGGTIIYEIHTGSYADRSAAAKAAAELQDDFQLSAAVVQAP